MQRRGVARFQALSAAQPVQPPESALPQHAAMPLLPLLLLPLLPSGAGLHEPLRLRVRLRVLGEGEALRPLDYDGLRCGCCGSCGPDSGQRCGHRAVSAGHSAGEARVVLAFVGVQLVRVQIYLQKVFVRLKGNRIDG